MSTHKVIEDVEPPVNEWDMCFTYLQDSIKSHQILPERYTLNTNFGLYKALLINYRENLLNLDTVVGFENIDYFYASKFEYYQADQLFNVLTHA